VTVYLAGEASADTRALVEDWLRSDLDLAAQVERARRLELPAVAAPSPTIEKQALDRTRRRLRGRGILLGAAIYFTTLPLAVTFGSDGFHGLLLEDWSARIPALVVAPQWDRLRRMSRPSGAPGL
jgi:ferric-dicitrate binding protein FerR (iron transport regulator)